MAAHRRRRRHSRLRFFRPSIGLARRKDGREMKDRGREHHVPVLSLHNLYGRSIVVSRNVDRFR